MRRQTTPALTKMSDDTRSTESTGRWRKIAIGVIAAVLLFFVISSTLDTRWIDQRFVGVWRVTNSISSVESIYVLNEDGSARWIERERPGYPWYELKPRGGPFSWSIGRDGFLLQNIEQPDIQRRRWFRALRGWLEQGWMAAPRIVRPTAYEIQSVSDDRIRLRLDEPGMILPRILTLDRIEPGDVPAAQRGLSG